MEGISSEAFKTGARAGISKPYDLSKLLEEVGRAIGEPQDSYVEMMKRFSCYRLYLV